ncbi:MAG: hypothetical protein SOZ80_05115 [Prevotella sp.]|uniref:hypothetical protein n=1 Tax=Prevotella sp. TaxID=59823 RepID=UPI002A2F708E|nr:hypothetical protein [Prevotella sp.]MDD7319222.1 hypothetical protein [Prevotellaceae bacterium]MDY4020141.1 hypothetical protein [Prevotella sp.]
MMDVDKVAKRYVIIGTVVVAVLTIVGVLLSLLRPEWNMNVPILVSVGFSVVFLTSFAFLWRWIMKSNRESQTTLYSVVSGLRMVLALFTLFVCFLVVGRDAMLPYVLVFMVYYIVMIAYHTVYFSKITTRQ